MQPETRYAKSGEVSIAYQVVGDGPFDVVFAPGIVSHLDLLWEMRTFQTRIAERLASFARLILFDKRGTGMSDRVEGVPQLETRMDDVRAVMDAAGSARAALVGIDDVAAMSLPFAATYPERTSALALLAASACGMWAPDYPWGHTAEQARALKENIGRHYFGSGDEGLELIRAQPGNFSDEEIWAIRDYVRRASSPGSMEAQARMLTDFDVRQVLPAIRVPTLLVHGTENPINPIGGARYMAGRIPGAPARRAGGRAAPAGRRGPRPDAGRARGLPDRGLAGRWLGRAGARAGACDHPLHGHRRFDRAGDAARRSCLARAPAASPRAGTAAAGQVPGARGEHRRRRVPCELRRAGAGDPVRAGDRRGRTRTRAGGTRGPPHGRVRAARRESGRDRGAHGSAVASRAAPGEVLVSSTVKDLVAGSGIAFQDRGTHELKGVPVEWRLYAVER